MTDLQPPGDPARHRMLDSIFVPSPLFEVAEAVSAATEHESTVYVERVGVRYRWALAHTGGPYPLLRITARFLRCDYTKTGVYARALGNGWSVVGSSRDTTVADAWGLLTFDGPTPVDEVEGRIEETVG